MGAWRNSKGGKEMRIKDLFHHKIIKETIYKEPEGFTWKVIHKTCPVCGGKGKVK